MQLLPPRNLELVREFTALSNLREGFACGSNAS